MRNALRNFVGGIGRGVRSGLTRARNFFTGGSTDTGTSDT